MSLLSVFRTPPPDVAVEIGRSQVSAARLEWHRGQAVVASHAVEPLPSGLVTPALAATNIADVGLVGKAVGKAFAGLGPKFPSRVALVVPDAVTKVSLVRLESVPSRSADLVEIVRWQVRKSAPFPIDQAVVSLSPIGADDTGGHEFAVALARADVIHQYEQACTMAGVQAGLVDLATFCIINGVLASGQGAPAGDWLLVHIADTSITLAVMRGDRLLFLRNRSEESEGTLADLIHQTAMYYEDRLKGDGFARVLLAGGATLAEGADRLRHGLEQRLGITVEAVDPRGAASLVDRISASPALLDALAPLVGVLRRERRAA
jgi:Tfp pilus assembly PilM family ATPase